MKCENNYLRLHLELQAVVFHLEIHPRWSNIEGDPLSPVERHLRESKDNQMYDMCRAAL